MFGGISNIFLIVIAVGLIIISIAIFQVITGGPANRLLSKTELTLGGKSFIVEVAKTMAERAAGLSGRDGLEENEGMLFVFDYSDKHSFWMKDMKFPIDIIWISGNRVVGFAENVMPEPGKKLWQLKTYSPPEPVDRVLEVNAGTAAKLGVAIGESVQIYDVGKKEN